MRPLCGCAGGVDEQPSNLEPVKRWVILLTAVAVLAPSIGEDADAGEPPADWVVLKIIAGPEGAGDVSMRLLLSSRAPE